METYMLIKAARRDGRSFHSNGAIDYAGNVGSWIEVDAAPADAGQCAAGIHASPTAIHACRASRGLDGASMRPWRFFLLAVERADVLYPRDVDAAVEHFAGTEEKWRFRRCFVAEELSYEDVFGEALAPRIARLRAEIATWKSIPWCRPAREIGEAEIVALVGEWRRRISSWLPAGAVLPEGVRVVRTREEARAAADDADAAADDAADAADAAAAADAALPYWLRWYVRPYYVLRRNGWALLAAWDPASNPWAPLVELYRLGAMPIGYVRGEFVVYVTPAR